MASSPITAWQKGEKAEIVTNFLFLGSRITVDSDCNHEIRRQLLLSRKVTDKPRQCVEKQRHYSADKGPYSQSYGLSSGHVWLWELDHKEGRMPQNWCLQTVVLEDSSRESWTAGRSNQSILWEINPEYSLEGLMLKLQYFGHLIWTDNSSEKSLMLGKIEGRRRRGWQDEMVGWHHHLYGHEFEEALGVGDGQRSMLQSMGLQRVGCDWVTEEQ